MSFSSLKKSNFADLLSKAESLNKTESNRGPDERLWKPEVDKAGNGYAVIRFLLPPRAKTRLGTSVESCLPRSWWMVYRELLDHFGQERSSVRTESRTVEQWC